MTDYPKTNDGATAAGSVISAAQAEREALALLCADSGSAPTPEQLAWRNDEPPSLEPNHRARNRGEAGLLLAAVFEPTEPAIALGDDGSGRAGYAVLGHRSSDDARVHPRLAEALAVGSTGLQERFSELWAVDWQTWDRLDTGSTRTIAESWLTSPGRRLISDLDVLLALRGEPTAGWDQGATDLKPLRLRQAIGLDVVPRHHEPWTELHYAIPGEILAKWSQRSSDPEVSQMITLFERGMPPMRQGAALAWLLDRAVDSPIYSIDELTRDLRQDLPVRLAAAFSTDGELAEHHRTACRLELVLLQHTACIAARRLSDWTTPDLWHLARWLHGTLVRSPWFGGDLPALVERLRAHLPESPPMLDGPFDVLHPARFRDIDDRDTEGLNPRELAVVAGAMLHYGAERSSTWTPAPRPLVHELRRIAQRPLDSLEKETERALELDMGGGDEMGWRSVLGRHIAPPIVARWLLSRSLRVGWMVHAISSGEYECVREMLGFFEADPGRYQWVCFAWMVEGSELPSEVQALARDTWRTLSATTSPPPEHMLAALGTGVIAMLSLDRDFDMLLGQARTAEYGWPSRLLNVIAERLESDTRQWDAVVDLLLASAADPDVGDAQRLESAVFAVRHLGVTRRPENQQRLQSIAALIQSPPLSKHNGLRRELRRLGFSPMSRASGVS